MWSRPTEVSTVSFEGITLVASRRPPRPASTTAYCDPRLREGDEGGRGEQLELCDRALVAGGAVGDLRRLLGALERRVEGLARRSARRRIRIRSRQELMWGEM